MAIEDNFDDFNALKDAITDMTGWDAEEAANNDIAADEDMEEISDSGFSDSTIVDDQERADENSDLAEAPTDDECNTTQNDPLSSDGSTLASVEFQLQESQTVNQDVQKGFPTPENSESIVSQEPSGTMDTSEENPKPSEGFCANGDDTDFDALKDEELASTTDDSYYGVLDDSSDDSLDIFEQEARFNASDTIQEPFRNYEGAMERNRARLRHQIATGEYVPDTDDSAVRTFQPTSPEEKRRRENEAVRGAKRLLQLTQVLLSYFKRGQEHNVEAGRRLLAKLFNFSYSQLVLVYASPFVDAIVKLTFYRDREVRRLAKMCFHRFRPMFIIPPGKTFLMVLQDEVTSRQLPWRMTMSASQIRPSWTEE